MLTYTYFFIETPEKLLPVDYVLRMPATDFNVLHLLKIWQNSLASSLWNLTKFQKRERRPNRSTVIARTRAQRWHLCSRALANGS